MRLNTLSPPPNTRQDKKRVGRGIGSGFGKTSGRGHKGQKSRSGGSIRRGFEGGQMPLYRRIPKFGFSSRKALTTAEVRLSELAKIEAKDNIVNLNTLKLAGIIGTHIKSVKVVLNKKIDVQLCVNGLRVTKGARAAIEVAGGRVE